MGPIFVFLAVSASPVPPLVAPDQDIVTIVPTPAAQPAARIPGPNLPASPRNNPGTWVSSSDYPIDLLVAKLDGTTGFRADVNRWGRVADCTVTVPSGHARLDEETCRLVVMRGWFNPATDKDAKPISGSYSSRVGWVIPLSAKIGNLDTPAKAATPPPPFFGKPGWVHQSFTITTEGRITDCLKTGDGPMANVSFSPCDMAARNLMPPSGPFRDAQGNPVERRVTLKSSIEIEPMK